MNKIYIKEPLKYIDDIPVFSDLEDEYIKNYEKIAEDHLNAIKGGVDNPFIDIELWNEMENSTLELVLKYLEIVKKQKEDKVKILDVGVGLGRLFEKILKKIDGHNKIELYGMDISIGYLKEARKKGINVALSKIEDMPYSENFFDIIICTDVLEHVFDLNLAIKKILNVLKPGGYLIVRVPNKEDLSSYASKDCPYEYVHLRNFDKFSLVLLFEKIFKMNVIEMTDSGYYPITSLLKYRLPIKGFNFILFNLCRIFKINKKIYTAFLKIFFEPVEINCVVAKWQ